MNFQYIIQDMELEVYIGVLNKNVNTVEEINKLVWISKESNFFDLEKFAGEGNIWHIIHHANNYFNL